jgi:uncharacterized protein (DUF488 family)
MLQMFEGQLDKIRLQKFLFLLTRKQAKPAYDFIPYRYGCYSFSAVADLKAMVRQGFLYEEEDSISRTDRIDYIRQLTYSDQKYLSEIKTIYGRVETDELIRYTYLQFPIYAINSEVADKLLSKKELQAVEDSRPALQETVLFTIGYEGVSLEEYLLRLIKNDVKVLVDVRNNPLSMKFGFSKNQLKKYCESLGINYLHFPELGIIAEQRQELSSQEDYNKLFDLYRLNNLSHTTQSQKEVLKLLRQHRRIALTCFEADINRCHRKHLAEAIAKLPGFTYEVKHI